MEHWDEVYGTRGPEEQVWAPTDYGSIALTRELLAWIRQSNPASIFEVGCCNSVWLPHVARKTGIPVAGLDYSEAGCELVRRQLAAAGVPGEVFCADLFNVDAAQVGRYDFVYSMGMVEHFTDTVGVLSKLLALVNPGGVLFTEVPNLKSLHGLMSWAWQPQLLAKHNPLSKKDLVKAYEQLGLKQIRGQHAGVFSLQIVAWDVEQRWPRLMKRFVPRIAGLTTALDAKLRRRGKFEGTAAFAPYIYALGEKPAIG